MTDILPTHSPRAINKARYLLRDGEVVAFPTDTVYGVACDALSLYAIRQLFTVKQRPLDKALPVFIAHINDLTMVAQKIPNEAWLFLDQFWPGALTVVLPKNHRLPAELTHGGETIAVRIPDHEVCLGLVSRVGRPLAVTSANISGQATPRTAQDVARQLWGRIPLVLDGGPIQGDNIPSTIIDFTASPPRVLRQGKIPFETMQAMLPNLQPVAE